MYLAYVTERDSVRPGREQFYAVLRQVHADSVDNGTVLISMDDDRRKSSQCSRLEMRAELQTFAKTACSAQFWTPTS